LCEVILTLHKLIFFFSSDFYPYHLFCVFLSKSSYTVPDESTLHANIFNNVSQWSYEDAETQPHAVPSTTIGSSHGWGVIIEKNTRVCTMGKLSAQFAMLFSVGFAIMSEGHQCKICGKKFLNQGSLYKHKDVHKGKTT
ncbi:hypothetical protein L9F63_018870, partial [Diploptera punctata]